MTLCTLAAAALLAGLALGSAWPAAAQSIPPAGTERPVPDAPSGSDKPLSDKLESTDGVIRPPTGISPDITTRPPVPNPGTTPVIQPGTIPQQPAR